MEGGQLLVQKAAVEQTRFQRSWLNGSMPPGDEKKLNKEQVETLRRWIEGGAPASRYYGPLTEAEAPPVTAEDRRFWAFRRLVEREIPRVRRASRVRTPVDAFVLAQLESKELTFSPQADRLTLVRRASLDLVGLPPSPEEIEAFGEGSVTRRLRKTH